MRGKGNSINILIVGNGKMGRAVAEPVEARGDTGAGRPGAREHPGAEGLKAGRRAAGDGATETPRGPAPQKILQRERHEFHDAR